MTSPSMARHLLGGLAGIAAAVLAAPLGTAAAAPAADEAYQLIATAPLPGNQSISAFDVSVADAKAGIFAFADRTNASVDIFALNDNEFLDGSANPGFPRQLTLAFQVPGFVGAKSSHALSGPDGLVVVNHTEIWAGDGNSTVKVINIASRQITDIIPTGGVARADEGIFDPVDQVVLIANDAESPFPFVSLISAVPDSNGSHRVLGQIIFDGSKSITAQGAPITLPAATNGIEASDYDRETGLFFLNIPQDGNNENKGALVAIDPRSFTVEKVFPVTGCEPAGLAIGPHQQALLGCAATNDTAATPLPAQVISLATGQKLATFPIKGNDEVWYNPGDNNYYAAGQTNVPPSLGIIHAGSLTFDESVPLAPGAHSVAADSISNRIFVPLAAGTSNTICPKGCVGIYASSRNPVAN